jgi:hypothetical protein
MQSIWSRLAEEIMTQQLSNNGSNSSNTNFILLLLLSCGCTMGIMRVHAAPLPAYFAAPLACPALPCGPDPSTGWPSHIVAASLVDALLLARCASQLLKAHTTGATPGPPSASVILLGEAPSLVCPCASTGRSYKNAIERILRGN